MGGFLFGELLFGELLGGELMGEGLLEGSLCLPIAKSCHHVIKVVMIHLSTYNAEIKIKIKDIKPKKYFSSTNVIVSLTKYKNDITILYYKSVEFL